MNSILKNKGRYLKYWTITGYWIVLGFFKEIVTSLQSLTGQMILTIWKKTGLIFIQIGVNRYIPRYKHYINLSYKINLNEKFSDVDWILFAPATHSGTSRLFLRFKLHHRNYPEKQCFKHNFGTLAFEIILNNISIIARLFRISDFEKENWNLPLRNS